MKFKDQINRKNWFEIKCGFPARRRNKIEKLMIIFFRKIFKGSIPIKSYLNSTKNQ